MQKHALHLEILLECFSLSLSLKNDTRESVEHRTPAKSGREAERSVPIGMWNVSVGILTQCGLETSVSRLSDDHELRNASHGQWVSRIERGSLSAFLKNRTRNVPSILFFEF